MLSTYLNIADLGVEVEHGSDLNGSSEPDVVHVQTPGTAFTLKEMSCMYFGIKWISFFYVQVVKVTKDMSIGPAQLKCLPHDEPTKDLVEPEC